MTMASASVDPSAFIVEGCVDGDAWFLEERMSAGDW